MRRAHRRGVLLLDINYFPWKTISWTRAIKLLYGPKDKAETIRLYYDAFGEFDPSVIRLIHRRCPPIQIRKRVKFTKKTLLKRDNYTCQYCGKEDKSDITIDHILPRSQGGKNTYLNCVAACYPCNQRKGDRTPEQWGIPLMTTPQAPTIGSYVDKLNLPEEWKEFIW